jgi:hypothetical protein
MIKQIKLLRFAGFTLALAGVLLAASESHAALIGKWTFNEGGGAIAYDYTSAANHGVIFGGASYVASPGETSSNSALHFDGIDDFVQYSHIPSYDVTGDFSMEAWVKLDSTVGIGLIFGQAVARFGLAANTGWVNQYIDNNPFFYNGGAFTPGTWQHVAAVWTQSSGQLQISVENGLGDYYAVDTTHTASPDHNNGAYYTGKSNAAAQFGWLGGEVDEIRYYNHALSQQEISASHSAGPTKLDLVHTAVLPTQVPVPYPTWGENLLYSHAVKEPGSDRVMRLAFSTPADPDTLGSALTYKMWYHVSTDNGATYDGLRPLIQSGNFNRFQPIEGVDIRKNSYVPSTAPPIVASNGEILVPFDMWPLGPDGEPLDPPPNGWTYSDAGVLAGRWVADSDEIEWVSSSTVRLPFAQSPSGAMEPAIVELNSPGKILMVMRGQNYGYPAIESHKWKSVSEDFGRTWSQSSELTYSNGDSFTSASSLSDIRRNSKNGQIYWFGHISESAYGNGPRYPFVVAQLDENSLGLLEPSLRELLDIIPETDSPDMQLAVSYINENTYDGSYTIRIVKYDTGKAPQEIFIVVPIFDQGDANFDNQVDGLDLNLLGANWQSAGTNWLTGDFNGDGITDGLDLNFLGNNWQGGVLAPGATIPEPASLALLGISAITLLRRRSA